MSTKTSSIFRPLHDDTPGLFMSFELTQLYRIKRALANFPINLHAETTDNILLTGYFCERILHTDYFMRNLFMGIILRSPIFSLPLLLIPAL